MSNATIYDVAGAAGVSLATVSRVLNNPEKVKEYSRIYYTNNREKCIAKSSEWYHKNKDSCHAMHPTVVADQVGYYSDCNCK